MNVEIGAEAALFPEKEYINVIAVAVWFTCMELERERSAYTKKHYCQTWDILGGYYKPDEAKTTAAMRPSAIFNQLIDEFWLARF